MSIKYVYLSDVCDLQNGVAFKSTDYIEKSNTCNIRMSNIRPGGNFDEYHNEKYLPDSYAEKYKDYLLNDGDLIIAMTDMATETKILGLPTLVTNTSGRKFLLNQRVGKLYKFSKDVYVPYLRHILTAKNIIDYYKSKGTGGLQINISKKDILSVKLPLPSLPVQQKIVAKLDAIFAEIDKAVTATEANIKNAEALFQSYLTEVFQFDGECKKTVALGDCCKTSAGGTPLKAKKEYYDGGAIPWLLSGEVCRKEIFSAKNFITNKGVENSSAKIFPKDTTLIAMYGATAGQVSILRFPAATNQAVCGILPNKNYTPEFLYYFLSFYKETLLLEVSGVAQPNLSQIKIKNIPLPLIDVNQQNKLVSKLNAISIKLEKAAQSYKNKVVELMVLKQSILKKTFSGELVKE